MNKNTVYILQKDLPNAKAGDKYESTDSGENYINLNAMATWDVSYPKEYIENNSDWFVKEEVNESKPTEKKQWEDEDDDFLWTNELVMEFVNFHDEQKGIHWLSEDIEKFKQSKSKKEEPQWEILQSYNGDVNVIHNYIPDNNIVGSESCDSMGCKIFSVKRFPDNTVWSVDMVTEHGIITAFKIVGSTMVAEIKNNIFPYDYPLYLSELKPPKETPKPEWEILKLEIGGVNYPIDALNEKEKSIAKIYSVKRLSDGEVFSVGDVVHFGFCDLGDVKIEKFVIDTFDKNKISAYHSFAGKSIMCLQKAPKEEQVPIKVYALHYYGGEPNYHNHTLICSERIPVEKYDALKKLIQDFLNSPLGEIINYEQYKARKYTESELLQARRDAFSSGYTRGWHNGCFEEDKTLSKKITDKKFEDYINSLK